MMQRWIARLDTDVALLSTIPPATIHYHTAQFSIVGKSLRNSQEIVDIFAWPKGNKPSTSFSTLAALLAFLALLCGCEVVVISTKLASFTVVSLERSELHSQQVLLAC